MAFIAYFRHASFFSVGLEQSLLLLIGSSQHKNMNAMGQNHVLQNGKVLKIPTGEGGRADLPLK